MTASEATYSLTWKLGTDSYLAPLFTVRGVEYDGFVQSLTSVIGEEAAYALLQKAAVYAGDGGMAKATETVQAAFPQAQPAWPQQPTGPTSNAQAQTWGAAAPPQQGYGQPQQGYGPPAGPPPGGPRMCPHGQMSYREAKPDSGQNWKGYFCPLRRGDPNQCKAQYL